MGAVTNLNQDDMGSEIGAIAQTSISPKRPNSKEKPFFGAYVALLLFMIIYCVRPQDWIPGLSDVPLAKITGILAILALVFSLRRIQSSLPREVLFLLFLIVQLFLASLMSPVWRGGALQTTLNLAKLPIIILVITAAVTTLFRLRLLIFTQATSVSIIASVLIWKGHLNQGRLQGILGGLYSDPNDLALEMVMSLPLGLALLFLTRNKFWKAFWAISILTMSYVVFLTGSRGGFLAFLVVVGVCLWEFAIRGRRRYLLTLAALAGFLLLQFSGGMLVGRLKGTFDAKDSTTDAFGSAQARQQLFWRSLQVTAEHPFFGVGPGNFDQVSGQWHTTHNSLTLMSSEAGIPAVILYVLILMSGFKNLKLTKRLASGQTESGVLARAFFASLAGYFVGSLFLSVAYQFFPYILVGYTTVLFSIVRKSNPQPDKCKLAWQALGENWV